MSPTNWTITRVRDLVRRTFQKRACLFQVKIGLAIRQRKNDVVGIAATGSGKTLSFWLPLLMALEDGEDKCMIVVTPLNLLGKQNIDLLEKAGISGVAVDRSNATNETFQDIAAGKHRVIVMNPEILMQDGGHCDRLWKLPSFTSRLLYVVFDEGHCIQEWNSFREQYKYVGALRHLIPDMIPFYVASATLPTPLLAEVSEILQLRKDRTEHILRSNDRPDIALGVRKMVHAASSFKDLEFLIPDGFAEGDPPPPRFLVFCNSIKETEAACKYLRSRLPAHLRLSKIKYFHASMTSHYRMDEYEALKNGDTFGLCVTDAFGMGLDLTGIQLVVQWKAPVSMNMLWQRFGRAARGLGEFAFAILVVEKQYFDDEVEKRELAKEKRRNRAKRKRNTTQKTAGAPKKRIAGPGNDRIGAAAKQTTSVDATNAANHSGDQEGLATSSDEDGGIAGESEPAPQRQQTSSAVKPAGKEERTPHAAILDLLNADSRKIGCRRWPITLVYSNDKRSWDHLECDPSSPSGCQRCAPSVSLVCCDLCHPLAFEELATTFTRPMKGTRKSTIKPYDSGQADLDLRNALVKWRAEETSTRYGPAALRNHGGSLILPDKALDRVIDCAHAGKLLSLEDVKRELPASQDWVDRYTGPLLQLVREAFPGPPEEADTAAGTDHTTAPGLGTGANDTPIDNQQVRKRKAPTCSRCKQIGHNSE
ncbi:P-loop containing nucleoside triphosphate hydrolase protein [Rhodofomes roseus]|uniref:DNA 3'-5' helicase n=1 Tax=Rhodofomes roseus TaxID=34475 RepID=A0ABQ8K9E5_9APHY|nr:P-loop containing nucleoside triphosphate hydrolase protein [Rhodofomes roseus]KAH9833827.1 P-loop containing nucleoside triphosphate hydrolase protein [Rhodofomes roseus]